MRIAAIEVIPFALPLRRAHSWAGNRSRIGRYALVRVRTDEGLEGIGEAPALIDWGGDHGRYGGESIETVRVVVRDHLAPALAGADPADLDAVHARMRGVVKGHHYARAAIDMACLDIAGRAEGRPVHDLLGGAVRTEIELAHSLGSDLDADGVEREAEAAVAEGIAVLKLKVGVDPDRDIAAMGRVRARCGSGVRISVDANAAWPDPRTAIEAIRRLDEHDVWYVEQPVEGAAALSEVRSAVRPPIMADESAWTAHDVDELAARGAVDLVSIYYSKPGGLRPAMEVAAACERHGLRANVNGSAESGLGTAAGLHLAAAARCADLPCLLMASAPLERRPTEIAARIYLDDLIEEPLEYRNGRLLVPDGPGLGVQLDETRLERYRLDRG